MEKKINVSVQEALETEHDKKKSLFSIKMCGETRFFENISGLSADELLKAYQECERPFVEMAKYGRQISTEEAVVIEQGQNFGFSIDFYDDDNEARIFDGTSSVYMPLKEEETIQEIPRAGRKR